MTPSPTAFPSSSSSSSLNFNVSFLCRVNPRTSHVSNHSLNKPHAALLHRIRHASVSVRVADESSRTEISEADKIVDGMDFGELCNEFECISSPLVESSARQLVRDILQLRQGNRALGTFAVSVKYKDPVRSFTGRDKYKRQLWATDALENPTVSVQQMVMLSTSVLNIKCDNKT